MSGSSNINIDSSTFQENHSTGSGSAFYFLGTEYNKIEDCTFSSNLAVGGHLIMLLFADTDIQRSTFRDNIADIESAGVFIAFSEVTIKNSEFITETLPNGMTLEEASKSSKNDGLYISISNSANVTITHSTFKNGYAQNGGYIYLSGVSDLAFDTCIFDTAQVLYDGGAIYAPVFKTLNIQNSTFKSIHALRDGTVFYLNSGQTSIKSVNITLGHQTSAIYLSNGEFTATNLKVMLMENVSQTQLKDAYGGVIYASNMKSLHLEYSEFSNISNVYNGGVIYLSRSASYITKGVVYPTHTIISWTFASNLAVKGGALYINNIDYLQIKGNYILRTREIRLDYSQINFWA